MASAKQLLTYFCNKASEEDCAKVLNQVKIRFKAGAESYDFKDHGLVNADGQFVSVGTGSIVGFELPESGTGTKVQESRTKVPEGGTKVPEGGTKVPEGGLKKEESLPKKDDSGLTGAKI